MTFHFKFEENRFESFLGINECTLKYRGSTVHFYNKPRRYR